MFDPLAIPSFLDRRKTPRPKPKGPAQSLTRLTAKPESRKPAGKRLQNRAKAERDAIDATINKVIDDFGAKTK